MTLSSYAELLLDEAKSERKRVGGEDLSLVHLALVLSSRRADLAKALGGRDYLVGLVGDPHLAGKDKVVAILGGVVNNADSLDRLGKALVELLPKQMTDLGPGHSGRSVATPLREADDASTTESDSSKTGPGMNSQRSDPLPSTPGLDSLPLWVLEYGEVTAPRPTLGRDRTVRQIIERIGRAIRPVTPLIAGGQGTGRTTLTAALAEYLQAPEYQGPLKGMGVFRVLGHKLGSTDASAEILKVVREIGPDSILVIDDLEVAATLIGDSRDLSFLRTLRALVADQRPRVVLLIDETYVSQLEGASPELFGEIDVIPLPLLDAPEQRAIVDEKADELERIHGVAISEDCREVALGQRLIQQGPSHPGLAVTRLDGACVFTRLDGRTDMWPADINGKTPTDSGPLATQHLVEILSAGVRGQHAAVERVARRLALTRNKLDLRAQRPDGVFLLVGPTGVGKTELARVLARDLLGSEDRMVRLDMSEYSQEWSISKIGGPPPGYVGARNPDAWLTTKVLARPDTVVLLDEFEKADPAVWNVFLQVFDDGRLTDSIGRTVDFSSVIFLLTSNLGTRDAIRSPIGFASQTDAGADFEQRQIDEVKRGLSPELVNRLDEIIVFRSLDRQAIMEIARQQVDRLLAVYRQRGFDLSVDDKVIEFVGESGYDPAFGARHLLRNIERILLEPLVGLTGERMVAHLEDANVVWTPAPS